MRTPKLYIGKTVRTLRADSGATQAEFAARLGLSTSYLNQIENNQRPLDLALTNGQQNMVEFLETHGAAL